MEGCFSALVFRRTVSVARVRWIDERKRSATSPGNSHGHGHKLRRLDLCVSADKAVSRIRVLLPPS